MTEPVPHQPPSPALATTHLIFVPARHIALAKGSRTINGQIAALSHGLAWDGALRDLRSCVISYLSGVTIQEALNTPPGGRVVNFLLGKAQQGLSVSLRAGAVDDCTAATITLVTKRPSLFSFLREISIRVDAQLTPIEPDRSWAHSF